VSDNRPRVLILGIPHFGNLLTEILANRGWDVAYEPHPGRNAANWMKLLPKIARADLLYLISARIERRSPLDLLLRVRRKPVVVHWVGTDALRAERAYEARNLSARAAEQPTHWADAPWLRDSLRDMGLRVEHVPIPVPGVVAETPPLPETFRVLMYLPEDKQNREVFDEETIMRLPGALPGVEFTIFPAPADTLQGPMPANLTAQAWTDDVDTLYRKATVYARLTTHDGMPLTLVEALSRGRHVIYPRPFPGVTQAAGLDEVGAALRGLKERHDAGALGLNQEGIAFVRDQYDPDVLTGRLEERLRAVLDG
jgi:hypothetical protein